MMDRAAGAYRWYVAILLSLCYLVSLLDRFIVGLVFEPLKAEMGLGDTQLGLLHGTGFVILYVLSAIPLGRMADLHNRRAMIVTGVALWSLATALCGFAHNFAGLFGARVLVGLGEACLVPAGMSMLAAMFPREQLGRAASIFTSGAHFGPPVAFIFGGMLLEALTHHGGLSLPWLGHFAPWQALFLFIALPGLPLALLFLFTVQEPARIEQKREPIGEALGFVRRNFGTFALFLGAYSCTSMIGYSVPAWTTPLLMRQHGLSLAEAAGITGTVLVIVGPLGTLIGGWLTDRLNAAGLPGPAILLCACCIAVPFPAVLLCLSSHLTLTVCGLALTHGLIGVATPAGFTGVQLLSPDRYRGFITSLSVATYTLIGFGMGPALVGILSDKAFSGPSRLGFAMLTLFCTVAAIGMVLSFIVRPRVMAALSRE